MYSRCLPRNAAQRTPHKWYPGQPGTHRTSSPLRGKQLQTSKYILNYSKIRSALCKKCRRDAQRDFKRRFLCSQLHFSGYVSPGGAEWGLPNTELNSSCPAALTPREAQEKGNSSKTLQHLSLQYWNCHKYRLYFQHVRYKALIYF